MADTPEQLLAIAKAQKEVATAVRAGRYAILIAYVDPKNPTELQAHIASHAFPSDARHASMNRFEQECERRERTALAVPDGPVDDDFLRGQ